MKLRTLASAALMISTTPAIADCIEDFDKKPAARAIADRRAWARAMRDDPEYKRCIAGGPKVTSPATRLATASPPTDARAQGVPPGWKPLPPPPAYYDQFYFMLRRDFNDTWLFTKLDTKGNVLDISDVKDAEGAEFSVSNDRLTHNTVWNAHAMASVVYRLYHDRFPSKDPNDPVKFNFIGLSVAPFVKIDRVTNSSRTAKLNNVDEINFGGALETGFDIFGTSHYFRIRGAGTNDRLSETTTGSGVADWTPIVDGLINSPLPLELPVTLIFAPQFRVRYDNVIVNDLTGAKDYLLRYGPAVSLTYKLDTKYLPPWLTSLGILGGLVGKTTVSWLTSAKTGDTYAYFNTSLTYNLDADGHVGLTGSYSKGRTEDTGRRMDLWKAGLTLKW